MAKFKYSVFIGRFSPFHNTHYKILQEALKQAETAIVVIGSARKAVDPKNPWTADQREAMMRDSLTTEENSRVKTIKMEDYLYNDLLWLTNIQEQISAIVGDEKEICLVGSKSDSSSYYLKLFPQWKYVSYAHQNNVPHATQIRQMYFENTDNYKNFVHPSVAEYMEEFKKSDDFADLQSDYKALVAYKKQWENSPFPPIFTTVDSCVVCSGHILLVVRGGKGKDHGKNKIALPGGFLSSNELIKDGVLRELKEETKIKISKEELSKSIKEIKVFDHPDRSLRGRTITHCAYFDLGSGELPMVKGGDDAKKAFWLPLSELEASVDKFFEDHYHIIKSFVVRF